MRLKYVATLEQTLWCWKLSRLRLESSIGRLFCARWRRSKFIDIVEDEQLVLGDTPLQVDETAIILKPDEFDVSFDGSEMSGRVWRIGKGSLFIDLTHLVLPAGGDLLDPPDDDPLLDYDPGQLPSANNW